MLAKPSAINAIFILFIINLINVDKNNSRSCLRCDLAYNNSNKTSAFETSKVFGFSTFSALILPSSTIMA